MRLRVKDDEPTIGFDVVAKERIRRIIEYFYQTRGITVLLTTHDLSDVERLCKWDIPMITGNNYTMVNLIYYGNDLVKNTN